MRKKNNLRNFAIGFVEALKMHPWKGASESKFRDESYSFNVYVIKQC